MQIPIRRLLAGAAFSLGVNHCQLFGQAMPQSFVNTFACRVVDTRVFDGGAGPIQGGTTRNFTLAAKGSCFQVSTGVAAYSLNITAVPPAGKALSYLTIYPTGLAQPPNASTLNNFLGTVVANAAIVQAGSGGQVTIYVSDTTDVIIDIDGYFVSQSDSNQNASFGVDALAGNTGSANTAVGDGVLQQYYYAPAVSGSTVIEPFSHSNAGNNNVAFGYWAQYAGADTVAFGYVADFFSGAAQNVAVGGQALAGDSSTTKGAGPGNVAIGDEAAVGMVGETYTTAVGYQAGDSGFNTAIGVLTKPDLNFSPSKDPNYAFWIAGNDLDVGNQGSYGDKGVLRIGIAGTHTSAYVSGISDNPVTGAAVLISSGGQVGMQSSSIRYKQDVEDMAGASDGLMKLHPAEFRYKQPNTDGSKPLQFGLMAEEVAQVYPELVVRGDNGQVDAVRYNELPSMLLNEIQKQQRTIDDQQRQIARQVQEAEDLKSEMDSFGLMLSNKKLK